LRGETGAQGAKGDSGATGPVGPQGDVGARGEPGAQGATGAKGDAGAAGVQGVKGDTGAAGPAGSQGVAGARGDTGVQGPIGPTGPTGPVGPAGADASSANFVDLTNNQIIDGTKQFQKAATNTTALNAGTSRSIDFGLSNLAYTNVTGSTQSYTLTNIKNGGAYTLVLTSTSSSGVATFQSTGFTTRYMGTNPLTTGKVHIYSFIVVGTVIYVSMATEN
jgi:hypothetical protein